MRHVIVHYHIYKNAGSTTDAILRQNFGPHCESIEGSNPWDTVSPEVLQRLVLNNPNVTVVSSHQARLPVPNLDNISFHPILFLRHPIDRVGSVYSFERNQPSDSSSLAVQVARTSNFADYFGFIDVGYTKHNESIDRRGTLYSRLEDIKSELGASIYQELLDNNALDISLYDAAKKQFLQMVPSRDVGLSSHA